MHSNASHFAALPESVGCTGLTTWDSKDHMYMVCDTSQVGNDLDIPLIEIVTGEHQQAAIKPRGQIGFSHCDVDDRSRCNWCDGSNRCDDSNRCEERNRSNVSDGNNGSNVCDRSDDEVQARCMGRLAHNLLEELVGSK